MKLESAEKNELIRKAYAVFKKSCLTLTGVWPNKHTNTIILYNPSHNVCVYIYDGIT